MPFRSIRLSPGMLVPPAIVGVLLILVALGLSISSGVRGYIGGANHWSIAQKSGVIALQRHAVTGDEADFAAYERSREVPRAVRLARLELQKDRFDRQEAIGRLVQGSIDRKDAPVMVWIFREFHSMEFFQKAIALWERADLALDSVHVEALALRSLVSGGKRVGDRPVDEVLLRLTAIDARLTQVELEFASTIAMGGRWLHRVLLLVIALAGLGLSVVGVVMIGRLSKMERRSAELEQQRDHERLAAERTLRERDDQLRQAQKMEAVGRLAGGVAHDFNNLLTVIRGNLDLALSTVDASSPAATDLAEAVRAAERAGDLTSQLLTFSRRDVTVTTALQLNEVVEETRNMLERLIGESVALVTVFEPHAPSVNGDASQLAQVVVNLVVNARDAMDGRGTITIRTRAATGSPPCDSVGRPSAADTTDWVLLEVSDEGVGIDGASRDRIFEPFFTTKPVGKGTGLGLPMVYGIVTAMHGAIEVRSAPGAGATFCLWLPASKARSTPSQVMTSAEELGTRAKGVVLVVEDEYMVRSLVCRVLEGAGYRVCEARHGREALEMLLGPDTLPDVIVSDVVMPEMGGRELAAQMRRRGLLVPMVFISGYSEDSSPMSGTRTQAAMLVQKPFTAMELKVRVAEVMREPGLG